MGVLDDIKARLDIVDVVSDHVQLKKAGRNFKAPCPFHSEKTPSFIVNPERQSWHCFGACSTGGDVFSFIMRTEKVEFAEALRTLAQRSGVSLERKGPPGRSDALHRVNDAAAAFYRKVLASPAGEATRKYLDERGVNDEMRETFKLGLSPEGGQALKAHLGDQGFDLDIAAEAGLIHKADDGRTRDFFWARLMFPIADRQGRIAGFGGRIMGDGQPKYLNTPATPIFDKRGTLYALNLAADSMRDRDAGVIVEGYMDAIAAHQHGFTNVVASMGTALTESQVGLLKSIAHNFVLALDPDAAGKMATDRGLLDVWEPMLRAVTRIHPKLGRLHTRAPIKLRIAALPEGKDPDELIRHSHDEWQKLTENAVSLMDYLIPAVAAQHDVTTDEGKAAAVQTLAPLITTPENPFEQARYRDQLAKALKISPDMLTPILQQMQRASGNQNRSRYQRRDQRTPAGPVIAANRSIGVEDYALALLFSRPELHEHEWVQTFSPQFFHKSESRELFAAWLKPPAIDALRDSLDASLHPV
ncbi:MAG: DNA primase, partial [Chloroflexi bacterium]|nr:DNA primase [Chloroflexota bacterium]